MTRAKEICRQPCMIIKFITLYKFFLDIQLLPEAPVNNVNSLSGHTRQSMGHYVQL